MNVALIAAGPKPGEIVALIKKQGFQKWDEPLSKGFIGYFKLLVFVGEAQDKQGLKFEIAIHALDGAALKKVKHHVYQVLPGNPQKFSADRAYLIGVKPANLPHVAEVKVYADNQSAIGICGFKLA